MPKIKLMLITGIHGLISTNWNWFELGSKKK
jgi:hypothetical protein